MRKAKPPVSAIARVVVAGLLIPGEAAYQDELMSRVVTE